LLVEDDHALREMYRATLVSAGFAVVAVEDGIDALRYIDGHTPNLVVLDLGLPRLGGEDVQRELASRRDTRDIPIVVVTGSDTRDVRKTDFDSVLAKPVSSEGLLTAIERALARASRLRGRSAAVDPAESYRRVAIRTVLVVDDEVSMQQLLHRFLEDRGYSVKTAGSVGEAIAVLERSVIDAVVLDVRMPRRSGLELLQFIRIDERRRDFPVVVLTGATLKADERELIARDASRLFQKSGDLEPLADHLDRVIH
jgi:CheY-like chemotaxis protein